MMTKLKRLATGAVMALIGWGSAQATTLSGILTADNLFSAYLSTDDNVLGTLITSGSDWTTIYPLPATTLTPGVTNYLHVIAQDQGLVFMFEGHFFLSDTSFQFANGGQQILTSPTSEWRASPYAGTWTAPTGLPVSLGYNPFCCTPWGNANMTAGAGYIWAAGAGEGSSAAFSTTITSNVVADAPEPAAWVMMLAGIFGAGAMLRGARRAPARA